MLICFSLKCLISLITMNTMVAYTVLSFSLLLPLCFLFGLPSGFWSHLTGRGGPGHRGAPSCLSPSWAPGGSTAAGAGNLAGWAGMWSLSPGMQIHDPRGDADSYTELLIYSQHSPGRGLRVWEYSTRTWLHTLTTFTNEYVKQDFATPFRQA